MCGISGYCAKEASVPRAVLFRMHTALAHRGPDGEGVVIWDAAGRRVEDDQPGAAGLAHRRLSIIDLSEAGRQPMSNGDGDRWIAFNGEIYNFNEERQGLEQRGRSFRSRTDTEVLLALCEEYGIERALQRTNGMFAAALWTQRDRELLLARDRLGKKPLYYLHRPDGALFFASELKSFTHARLVDRTDLDPVALAQVWQYGYTMGERTIYQSVRRLLPGHYARWRDGQLEIRRYWENPFAHAAPRAGSLDALADELDHLLCDAIRLRLVSDVPLGLFLSGGIDSSLIAALAAKVGGRDVRTFSVAFREAAFNEAPHAQAIARQVGLPNETLEVTDSLGDYFRPIARHFDEPFGDSSAIPTWFLCQRAREHVTVALTGDGGDELFAGYPGYGQGLRVWGTAAERAMAPAAPDGHARRWESFLRFTSGGNWPMHWNRLLNFRRRRRLLASDFARRALSPDVWAERGRVAAAHPAAGLLGKLQHCDLERYLPDDILVKVDRMSMAHALECRSPLLDHRIVEFAARLPLAARIGPGGRGKELLRVLLARYVPTALFERPKQGFSIPWEPWCRGARGVELRQRWEALAHPAFRRDSGRYLFPENGAGHAHLQWCAFSTLVFLENPSA